MNFKSLSYLPVTYTLNLCSKIYLYIIGTNDVFSWIQFAVTPISYDWPYYLYIFKISIQYNRSSGQIFRLVVRLQNSLPK